MAKKTPTTKLAAFMAANRIRPVEILERVTFGRGLLYGMRSGHIVGSPGAMGEVRDACSAILGRDIGIEELFSFSQRGRAARDAARGVRNDATL